MQMRFLSASRFQQVMMRVKMRIALHRGALENLVAWHEEDQKSLPGIRIQD